jgi:hypothetical protein
MNFIRTLFQSGAKYRHQHGVALLAIVGAVLPVGCDQNSSPDPSPPVKSGLRRASAFPTPNRFSEDEVKLAKSIRDGDVAQVRQVVKKNPKILQAQWPTGTPLHSAVVGTQNVEIVRLLLESGADVNVRNKRGEAPLSIAVAGRGRDQKTRIVELLLAHGAGVNTRIAVGQDTPLHTAAFVGDVAVVKLLLSHKADVNATNSRGKTPLQLLTTVQERRKSGDKKILPLAKFFDIDKWPEIITLLRQSGAK